MVLWLASSAHTTSHSLSPLPPSPCRIQARTFFLRPLAVAVWPLHQVVLLLLLQSVCTQTLDHINSKLSNHQHSGALHHPHGAKTNNKHCTKASPLLPAAACLLLLLRALHLVLQWAGLTRHKSAQFACPLADRSMAAAAQLTQAQTFTCTYAGEVDGGSHLLHNACCWPQHCCMRHVSCLCV